MIPVQLCYFEIMMWDVVTYSSGDLYKYFEGTVPWNIVSNVLYKIQLHDNG
jgi:hypothetical protein